MSSEADAGLTRVTAPRAAGSATSSFASAETVADREVRNPFFAYLMHLGLPLSVSLIVHVGLLSFLALKTFRVLTQPGIEVGEYEASVTQSLADQMDKAFQWQNENPLVPPEDTSAEALDSLTQDLANFDAAALEAADPGPGGEGSGLGIGDGPLSLLGIGSGAGEAGTAGFGQGLGGGQARIGQAGMWNLNVRANKIVYVVDYSGSITTVEGDLKKELKRSISRLKDTQSFDVILFYSPAGDPDKSKSEMFKPKLEPASDDVRREFFEWIGKKAQQGDTEPLPAVKRALEMRPDVIFFLSDGLFDESVVGKIKEANNVARAKIYCLVFDEFYLYDTSGLPPKDREGSLRLKRIAEANGGKTTIVTGKDLSR